MIVNQVTMQMQTDRINNLLERMKGVAHDTVTHIRGGDYVMTIVNSTEDIAHFTVLFCPFLDMTPEEKYELLETDSLRRRGILVYEALLRFKGTVDMQVDLAVREDSDGRVYKKAAIRKQTSVTFCGKVFDTKSADGVCLFSTAHPPKVKGTNQSNLFADAFSNDALMAAEERMQNMTDDRGNVLDIAPDTILIPNQYALKKAVFAAIGADKDPATANNGFNYNFGRWNVIVWPYLNGNITSGTSPWVLMDSRYNKDYGGALWFDRTGLEVKSLVDDGSDANVWHGYSRFIAGFSDFRFAACGGVTGGTQMISD